MYTNWPGGSGWGMYPGCQTVRRTASSHSVWKGGGEVWQPALRLSRIPAPGSAAPGSLFNRNSWNLSTIKTVLRIRIRDPVLFWPPGSGIGKKSGSGSGMNNPDHNSESLETIFWVKLQFFDADPVFGIEKNDFYCFVTSLWPFIFEKLWKWSSKKYFKKIIIFSRYLEGHWRK